jgi:predicted site-specific integrase-resolvase
MKINGQTFYGTSEACNLVGINKYTFLRWVREKRFSDVKCRDRNDWRLFTDDDIRRLKDKVNHVEKVETIKRG